MLEFKAQAGAEGERAGAKEQGVPLMIDSFVCQEDTTQLIFECAYPYP
jgi:hypothetical protein